MKDERLIGAFFTDAGFTHSKTILPMIEDMMKAVNTTIDEVDVIAVTVGPGSFTGLRIGLATVKGLAFSKDIPCIPVSTIEALAYNMVNYTGLVVPVMDARRNQVYTGAYLAEKGKITQVLAPTTLLVPQLKDYLLEGEYKDIMLVGDGAELCLPQLIESLPSITIAPFPLLHQRAESVLLAARENLDKQVSSCELRPEYLRIPQAERERNEQKENKKEN